MNRETAYRTAIPPDAEPRSVDGHPSVVDYWLNEEHVGRRQFDQEEGLIAEWSFRAGIRHGMQYSWCDGTLFAAEPFEDGVPHGTAYQWGGDGRVIGTYTLERGTGIDLWRQDQCDGSVKLSEVHYMRNGVPHGFEWWLWDEESVWEERHWQDGNRHGIEREWNFEGRLRRGYPRYWVGGERVAKRRYLRAAAADPTLPPFLAEDNSPRRTFPAEIREAMHITVSGA